MNTIKFEQGQTYATRSICDYDWIITVEVLRRTPKTVVAIVNGQREKRLRIRIWEGVEQVEPMGRYSMSPVVSADKTLERVEATS